MFKIFNIYFISLVILLFANNITSGSITGLHINPYGQVGIGTDTPNWAVVVEHPTNPIVTFKNSTSGVAWAFQNINDNFRVTKVGTGVGEFTFDETGSLTVLGSFISGATTLNVPDYVFKEDYPLMSLENVDLFINEHGHLPNVPSEKEIKSEGVNLSQMQMTLLEKIEELTLHLIKQQQRIVVLEEKLSKSTQNN